AGSNANATIDDLLSRPGWSGWVSNVMTPYAKSNQIWACPSESNTNNNVNSSGTNFCAGSGCTTTAVPAAYLPQVHRVHYGYNYSGVGNTATSTPPGANYNEADMLDPVQLAIMWDSRNRWADGVNFWNNRDVFQFKTNSSSTYTNRHLGTANWLFADGHVKSMGIDRIYYRNIGNMATTDPKYNMLAIDATCSASSCTY
ncbi:MAG: hypothetical protein M3347_10430, partial [Armatimonadota bacterium]|nr:hypothetical protein [Armatimonadota bacterium]